jgi:hypothetical protein
MVKEPAQAGFFVGWSAAQSIGPPNRAQKRQRAANGRRGPVRPARAALQGQACIIDAFSCTWTAMEAERINTIASFLSDLDARARELRRYL